MSNETVVETVEETVEEVVVDTTNLKQKSKGIPETDAENVIGSSRTNAKGGKKYGAVTTTKNGAIGSGPANRSPKIKAQDSEEVKIKKVALFSTRNVLWEGVGKINKGYNIVDEAKAEEWLKRDHVRIATPEEVAEEYGV